MGRRSVSPTLRERRSMSPPSKRVHTTSEEETGEKSRSHEQSSSSSSRHRDRERRERRGDEEKLESSHARSEHHREHRHSQSRSSDSSDRRDGVSSDVKHAETSRHGRSEEEEASSSRSSRRSSSRSEVEVDSEEAMKEMMRKMGLPVDFDSTKGKKVTDNIDGYAKIRQDRRFRQYMNRSGGFNQNLATEEKSKFGYEHLERAKKVDGRRRHANKVNLTGEDG